MQYLMKQGMRIPRALFIAVFLYCIRAQAKRGRMPTGRNSATAAMTEMPEPPSMRSAIPPCRATPSRRSATTTTKAGANAAVRPASGVADRARTGRAHFGGPHRRDRRRLPKILPLSTAKWLPMVGKGRRRVPSSGILCRETLAPRRGSDQMSAKYDTIGLNYAELRRPDRRIAMIIDDALGQSRTVLNVGAGTGSYEPTNRTVVAVEPSSEMIKKRGSTAAQVIQASAEELPFDDKSFDASMAILTIHHWPDKKRGLREMRRVTRGPIVLLTFDPSQRPWLTDYLPELAVLDENQMPQMADYQRWLGNVQVNPVLVPHDCTDGFLYAYWRRPAAYLDPYVRSGSSSFWAIGSAADEGLQKLEQDLETGEWKRRYAHLLERDAYDAGFRLVVAG